MSIHKIDIAPAPKRELEKYKWIISHVLKYMNGIYTNMNK